MEVSLRLSAAFPAQAFGIGSSRFESHSGYVAVVPNVVPADLRLVLK